MRRAYFVQFLTVAVGLLWSLSANATTFSVGFDAPTNCPSKDSLIGQVLARTSLAEPVESAGTLKFDVRLSAPSNAPVVGTLAVRIPTGKTSLRSLDGDTCEEVVTALALIMALTMDPKAQVGPIENGVLTLMPNAEVPPPATSQRDPLSGETSAKDARLPQPTQTAPLVAVPRTQTEHRTTQTRERDAPPSKPSEMHPPSWRLLAGPEGVWTHQLTPGSGMFQLGGQVALETRSGFEATLAGLVGPKARYSNSSGDKADITYYGGALGLGWQVFAFGEFRIAALSLFSIGRVHATGVTGPALAVSHATNATWFGAGPGVELSTLSSWGGGALQAAVPFGIARPRFLVTIPGATSDSFFEAGKVGLQLTLRVFFRCLG